jgi:hypothetical protein
MKEELSPMPALASNMLDLRTQGDNDFMVMSSRKKIMLLVYVSRVNSYLVSPTKSLDTTSSSV